MGERRSAPMIPVKLSKNGTALETIHDRNKNPRDMKNQWRRAVHVLAFAVRGKSGIVGKYFVGVTISAGTKNVGYSPLTCKRLRAGF